MALSNDSLSDQEIIKGIRYVESNPNLIVNYYQVSRYINLLIDKNPSNSYGYALRSILNFSFNMKKEAIRDIDKALKIKPKEVLFYEVKALFYSSM